MDYVLTAEFDDGRTVELAPRRFEPLRAVDIATLERNPEEALTLELEGDEVLLDGKKQVGPCRLRMKIDFHESVTIFALVPGGWLPMPFAAPARFLVDRNVVSSLAKLRQGGQVAQPESLRWWTDFFKERAALFNPLPFAMEAGYRRKPSFAEFRAAFDTGSMELLRAIPGCQVVNFEDTNYAAAYSQLEAFDARAQRETAFLQAVCPLVSQRVARGGEASVEQIILETADDCQVRRGSFVVLVVLSCLYEAIDGATQSIGRRILKPRAGYAAGDAFNALSDLRHIELAAAGHAYFGTEAFSLCTRDRALALLWSSLSISAREAAGERLTFAYELNSGLFSRLLPDGIDDLKGRLGS